MDIYYLDRHSYVSGRLSDITAGCCVAEFKYKRQQHAPRAVSRQQIQIPESGLALVAMPLCYEQLAFKCQFQPGYHRNPGQFDDDLSLGYRDKVSRQADTISPLPYRGATVARCYWLH